MMSNKYGIKDQRGAEDRRGVVHRPTNQALKEAESANGTTRKLVCEFAFDVVLRNSTGGKTTPHRLFELGKLDQNDGLTNVLKLDSTMHMPCTRENRADDLS